MADFDKMFDKRLLFFGYFAGSNIWLVHVVIALIDRRRPESFRTPISQVSLFTISYIWTEFVSLD